MIDRMPKALRADLRESTSRLLTVRSPKQAVHVLEGEFEHILRLIAPVVIERPRIRRPVTAAGFTASIAAFAATIEEAEELLTFVSAGTLTAPGMPVVVAIGFLSAAAEAYAAASVRVHQLRQHQCTIDVAQLASDVRHAMLGDLDIAQGTIPIAKRVVDGAAGRLTTRWAMGLVPVVGIGYAAFDSARTVQRILRVPLPMGEQ